MAKKSKLSKSILEMKFMKRTKDKVFEAEDNAEGRAMYFAEITEKMLQDNSKFIVEPSYVPCENLIDGRFSFRGMNPEIERILELEAKQTQLNIDGKMDISDENMATYYTNLTKTKTKQYDSRNRRKINLPDPINDAKILEILLPKKKPRVV